MLYGDGVWEIAKADKERRDKVLNNIALAGNAASTVAGPAAIYSAVRNRSEGGIPRDIGRGLGAKLSQSSGPRRRNLGVKMKRVADTLDKPGSSRAKLAAGAAGATMIGLQGVNMGTDALSTVLLRDKNKDKNVSKADETVPLRKGARLVKVTLDSAAPIVATKSKDKAKLVATKARDKASDHLDFVAEQIVSKADDEKRQVYGWVSVVEVNGQPVVDRQNDYVSIEEIEKAAHDYLTNSRDGGDMHKRRGVSRLIESFVVTPEKKELLGLPEETPLGWWCGFQVEDDDVWEMVKNGERPAFSIHGSGRRVETVL